MSSVFIYLFNGSLRMKTCYSDKVIYDKSLGTISYFNYNLVPLHKDKYDIVIISSDKIYYNCVAAGVASKEWILLDFVPSGPKIINISIQDSYPNIVEVTILRAGSPMMDLFQIDKNTRDVNKYVITESSDEDGNDGSSLKTSDRYIHHGSITLDIFAEINGNICSVNFCKDLGESSEPEAEAEAEAEAEDEIVMSLYIEKHEQLMRNIPCNDVSDLMNMKYLVTLGEDHLLNIYGGDELIDSIPRVLKFMCFDYKKGSILILLDDGDLEFVMIDNNNKRIPITRKVDNFFVINEKIYSRVVDNVTMIDARDPYNLNGLCFIEAYAKLITFPICTSYDSKLLPSFRI